MKFSISARGESRTYFFVEFNKEVEQVLDNNTKCNLSEVIHLDEDTVIKGIVAVWKGWDGSGTTEPSAPLYRLDVIEEVLNQIRDIRKKGYQFVKVFE